MNKPYPNLVPSKSSCCGCGACYSICPVNAINMELDNEGFLYPSINKETCIKCHLCLNICIFKEDQKRKGMNHESF